MFAGVGYRPEIDGLRALAVVIVVLFHAGVPWFSGGYVGVDVFFVISGYLITGILLREIRAGSFSYRAFYERRARRILPALLAVLSATLPLAYATMLPEQLESHAAAMLTVFSAVSNVWFWRTSGYFGETAELQALLHTWSLSVEEQFYLFFPLVLTTLLRWRKGRRLVLGLVMLALVSFAVAQWGILRSPVAAFYLIVTRAWELMAGALLASSRFGERGFSRRAANECGAVVGMVAIVASTFLFDSRTPFPGWPALLPVAGTVLLIATARPGGAMTRLLALRPVVFVGLVSYSLYLWHQPLMVFARLGLEAHDGDAWLLGAGAISLPLAALSWWLVEQPFRSKRADRSPLVSPRALVGTLGGWTAALSLLAGLGLATGGFEQSFLQGLSPDQRARFRRIEQHAGKNLYHHMVPSSGCVHWSKAVDAELREVVERCAGEGRRGLLLVGDSHAMNLFNVLAKSKRYPFLIGVSQGGCRPHDPRPNCHYEGVDTLVEQYPEAFQAAMFHQSGSYLLLDGHGRPDAWGAFVEGAEFSPDLEAIDAVWNYVRTLNQRVPTTWVGPWAEGRVDYAKATALDTTELNRVSLERFEQLDRVIEARGPDLSYRSMVRALDLEPEDFVVEGDCLLFGDADHFSPCGEDWLAGRLRL